MIEIHWSFFVGGFIGFVVGLFIGRIWHFMDWDMWG